MSVSTTSGRSVLHGSKQRLEIRTNRHELKLRATLEQCPDPSRTRKLSSARTTRMGMAAAYAPLSTSLSAAIARSPPSSGLGSQDPHWSADSSR